MKRQKYGNLIRWRAWGLVFVMLTAGLALIIAAFVRPDEDFMRRRTETVPAGEHSLVEYPAEPAAVAEAPFPDVTVSEDVLPDERPVVALLVDDFGYNLDLTERIADCGLPLTWAILPYLEHSGAAARLAGKREIPYFLHLPMQAEVDGEGGPFLVGVAMGEESVRQVVRDAIDSLPGIAGVNNHRGSKATSDAGTMAAVLDVVGNDRLLFVDSRTSSRSVAYPMARERGIPAAYNSHFLDNQADVHYMEEALVSVTERARREGGALAICHVRPRTVEFLEKLASNRPEGIRFVTVPELISILGTR